MPSRDITVIYGDMNPRKCQLCGKLKARFGSLIDCNGHSWLVCMDCVDGLWHRNAAVIQDSEVENRARQLIQERLLGLEDG